MYLRLIIILLTSSVYSQPGFSWQKTLGGTQNDVSTEIKVASDNNFIIGGTSNSGISGNKTQIGKGENDFWLIKLDDEGNVLWQKVVGGSESDTMASICVLADNSILACGSSQSGISGDKTEANRGFGDYWIIKLNEANEIIWQRSIGGSNVDILRSVQQTTDGGFILGGTSASNISGEKSENARGSNSQDYWIVKGDALGVIEWQKTYGGSLGDDLSCILQVADSGYIVGGHSSSEANFDKTENSFGGYDYWILKLNNIGEIEWQKTVGGSDMDYLKCAIVLPDGYLFGGYSASGISGNKTEPTRGGFDYWIVKLDFEGNIDWQKNIGGDSSDFLYSICEMNDAKIILAGSSESSISGDKIEVSRGMADIWLVKIDATGNLETQNTFGGDMADGVYSLLQMPDNSITLAGNSRSSISGEKLESCWGESDYWVIKLDSNVLNTQNANVNNNDIKIYPNPTNKLINIASKNPHLESASLYDAIGRRIYHIEKPNSLFTIEINSEDGVYFLNLVTECNKKIIHKIIKRSL